MVDEIRARSGWRVLSGDLTGYGASGARVFAIYEHFKGTGGGFVVCSISMNKKGKITPTHQHTNLKP
ncbi:hypothetical protein DNT99_25585 [Escherichia coli]|nr:hypothetical protein [Escherichia coli]EFO1739505.1 hypothetical protein [Escherichia coli]EFO3699052.1 hypothetical protein [Escherichia coli]